MAPGSLAKSTESYPSIYITSGDSPFVKDESDVDKATRSSNSVVSFESSMS